tara:strand:- start:411 stop:575 length:165 start_codon:yes stop_codon:yes gene_type:complete
MFDFNDIMLKYMKKPDEENKIEKIHKKKKLNVKKMRLINPYYDVFGKAIFEIKK